MGNYWPFGSGPQEPPPVPRPVPRPSPPPPPPEPYDRVFILIGKAGGGKSSLGNRLLGREIFPVSQERNSYSTTTKLKSDETELAPGTVSGMNFDERNLLRIRVFDQPGMDDAIFKLREHCDNLIKCMKEIHVKTFPTFLIVINLSLNHIVEDNCLLLAQLSESLMQASYSLFSHAVVVFTHIDQLDPLINSTEALMEFVRQKFQRNTWAALEDILDAVNNRCIFVDTTNTDALYRNRLLRDLFLLSKCTLQIRFHGNNSFSSDFLKQKLGILGNGVVEEELYKFDYQFHSDLNVFRRDALRNLDQQIERALISLIALGEGVSSIVILVSLENSLSQQMEKLIYELPSCYISENNRLLDSILREWWDHVFIVFKVPSEASGKATVERNLSMNPKVRSLLEKGSKKCIWIAKDTSVRICRDRITQTCLMVRKQTGGKVFIENTVAADLRRVRDDIDISGGGNARQTQINPTLLRRTKNCAIHFIESGNSTVLKFGEMTIRDEISISSLRIALRNMILTEEEMKRFRERYQVPEARVSILEILEFLETP